MPKRIVDYHPDGIYHLYNRGVDGREIFLNHNNYTFFPNKITYYAIQTNSSIIAFCLIPTHYHLLVRQNGIKSAGLICQLACNSYSKAFNFMNHRTGALFESRYKSIFVNRDEYLYPLCRYIHANPVKAGSVRTPEKWAYSDYQSWINDAEEYDDPFSIKGYFSNGLTYRAFVLDYLNDIASIPRVFNRYTLDG